MKIWATALASLLLGVGMGWCQVRWFELSAPHLRDEVVGGATQAVRTNPEALPTPAPGQPHVVVENGSVHNFGVMARDTSGSHKFLIRNDGEGVLTLHVENTTCKCTGATLGKSTLAPGESTEAHLQWDAKGFDEEFRHGATLRTNDPVQSTLMLTIQGRIRHVIRAIPESLRIDRITVHDRQEFQVKVFGYREDPLLFHDADFTNEELKSRFEVELLDLPADEIAKETDAKYGFQVLVRILPGMPMGSFQQTLRLSTSYDEISPLEIPISGVCTSDISILGPGYSPDTQVLHWGVVDREVGGTKELFALVRGPHREGFQMEPASSDPPGIFRIEIGEPAPYNQGLVVKVPMKIHIDPGHDSVSRLAGKNNNDYGHIVLKTNHPDAPTLKLFVRFGIR